MAELAPQKKTPDSFTVLMIRLFKGVLYREDAARDWQTLMEKQPAVRDYVSKVGLALEVNEAEGHAFLKSLPEPEDEDEKLPRLISRRQLSFPLA